MGKDIFSLFLFFSSISLLSRLSSSFLPAYFFYSQYLTYLKYQWVKYILSYLISPIFSFLSVLHQLLLARPLWFDFKAFWFYIFLFWLYFFSFWFYLIFTWFYLIFTWFYLIFTWFYFFSFWLYLFSISLILSFLSVLSFLSYQASIFSCSHSFKISNVSMGKLHLFLYFNHYGFFFHFKVLFYTLKNNFER